MKHNIALIGPMASGKTTIGKLLAKELGWNFVDCDQYIEFQEGMTVAEIFQEKGEDYFRKQEEHAIAQLARNQNIILATGGGTVKSKQSRLLLKQNCFVIYLEVSIDDQLSRTQDDLSRPLINVDDRRSKLELLQQERTPLYQEIADKTISSSLNGTKEILIQLSDINYGRSDRN